MRSPRITPASSPSAATVAAMSALRKTGQKYIVPSARRPPSKKSTGDRVTARTKVLPRLSTRGEKFRVSAELINRDTKYASSRGMETGESPRLFGIPNKKGTRGRSASLLPASPSDCRGTLKPELESVSCSHSRAERWISKYARFRITRTFGIFVN